MPSKSFLQTKEWLDFQKSIGRSAERFDNGKITANIIQHDLPFKFNYLYIPHGPEIDFNAIEGTIGHEVEQFILHVKKRAQEEKSIFVKVEPLDAKIPEVLHQFKFKKSKKEVQPHKTIVVDLSKSEEELLAGMHHKTRYNIKVAEKHGVTVEESNDVEVFWKLLKKTAERQKFSTHEKGYYKKIFEFFREGKEIQTKIFFAMHENKSIAGGLMLLHADTAYYLHGGSDNEYRQLMAPYAFHWLMMNLMKEQGFKFYDFGGSEGDKYPGVTRFKLGWGGQQISYPGAFDLSIRSFWFMIYKILRKIF
jgi:peptidoglycan pentaglycine glycine transferase (the first glycine)